MHDSHLHTEFSTDSKMKVEEAIRKARENSIGLTITEHMEIQKTDDIRNLNNKPFTFDARQYFNAYEPFRNKDLLLGIELGMHPEAATACRNLVESYPFDYVIGALHMINDFDIEDMKLYEESQQKVYEDYFNEMIDAIHAFDFIDSLAHIDFISRYAPYEEKEIFNPKYYDHLSEVIRLLIEKEIVLEINTKRFNLKSAVENMSNICLLYKQRGGNFISIGSDAHTPNQIGRNFDIAVEIALKCGLRVVNFDRRKMNYLR